MLKKCRCLKQVLIFCILICFLVSVDGFAKDISFDEVPEAIQKIVLREIGDVPISDVDREREDGETVYDIEAKDDSIDIELEIAADGTFREKDVTEKIAFSELPIPVQDTVHQQVGTLKINDVERRTELGMSIVGSRLQTDTTYYNVEAEAYGVEIDLEIAPDGRLLDIDMSDPIRLKVKLIAKSKIPTLADIAPYREALVFYEYSVRKRVEGKFTGKKLRVAHWAIYDNQPQAMGKAKVGSSHTLHLYPYQQFNELKSLYTSDTLPLDLDTPLYHDVGQKILENRSVEERYDYDSIFSEKMPIFWRIKDQLKLVSLGDSRGASGVRAEMFYGEENQKTPVAYNLAISGGPLEFQEIVVDKYLTKMPNLEWVVYQMSPRAVKRYFEHSADRELLKSRGFAFDRKHAETLWQRSDEGKKTVAGITSIPHVSEYWNERPWGWKFKAEVWQNPKTKRFERKWEISKKRWNRLTSMIAALNERDVKMLLYLSPLHPIMQGQPVVDDDGTTQKGYRQLVGRLKELEAEYPNFVFVDFLQGGNHDFLPEMFKDLDHLNALGATKLTQALEEVRQRYNSQHP
ncbi:hypothetical protein F4054_04170 [Candidatus Poribacteria bacterium]|nr:hypothetical protein [Candidatus Poribacteria bacterium]MYG05898.1 hypothetical protein [Candidatus Poribacteria bacterium]MYK21439.1 hypothetical protein [Candidatus Poribacteria bacterium]